MTVSDNLPIKRLKIKLKNTEFVVTSGCCKISQQVWINGNKESMMKKSNKATPHSSDILKSYGADSFKVGFPMQISRKRGLLEVIDSVVNKRQKIKKSNEATPHSSDILKSYGADSLKVGFPMQSSRKCRPLDSVVNKRQKMDPSLKRLCFSILEELIKHPAAWAFNQPVDPEKLNIPDYFSVVSSPMDLGTVRTKLQDNMYFSVKEFKDDVRLTFSNAILYNPSDNFFNITAKKLDSIFNTKWKSLEARFKCDSINRKQSCLSSGRERKTVETEHLCPRSSPMHSGLAPTMSLSFLEKKERTEATRGNITENSKMLDARAANEVPARNIQNSRCPGKVLQKGTVSGNRSTCGSVKITASLSMVASRCRSCGSLKCHCSPQNGYAYASKTLASERYTGQDCDASKMDHESSLISNTCKSDPESDGTVSARAGEKCETVIKKMANEGVFAAEVEMGADSTAPTVRATVVQASTIFYDTPSTLDKAERLLAEAVSYGSQLVVFPEAFVGGYPRGSNFGVTVGDRTAKGKEEYRKYHAAAIDVPGPEVDRLAAMAGRYKVYLVMGVIERDGYTLYCTILFFDSQGHYLGKHRKLMPTALERIIWGFGDGSTIPVFETPIGKIGAAICWENKMPLLRTAMYAKGVEIYCAPTADSRPVWQASMTHIALEGGCFVLSANQFCRRKDYPPPPEYVFTGTEDDLLPDSVVCAGGSVIISPSGTVLAGPNYEGEALITADLDLGEIANEKFTFDVVGHYSRPEVFSLGVRDHPMIPVTFTSASASASANTEDSKK